MKSYTDISQSQKLVEILPLESADMWYHPYPNDEDWYDIPNFGEADLKFNQLPCWSLVALLEVLPKGITLLKNSKDATYSVFSTDFENVDIKIQWHNSPIDACYELILKLHELNLL